MRVLVVTPEAFGGYGGIAQLTSDLATALSSAPGVTEVTLLSRETPDAALPLPEKVSFARLPLPGRLGFILALLGNLAQRRFDLVLCTHIHLLRFAALVRRRRRGKLLLVIHGVEIWRKPRKLGLDRALAATDRVLSVSAYSKSKLLAWAPLPEERVTLLPCCVDLRSFQPGLKDEALLERHGLAGKRVLLLIARLSSEQRSKGVDQVLDVLPALAEEDPQIVFAVGGKGDDRERLEAKARELGVAERVRFLGFVGDAEKVALYRSAEAFVLASRGEGFGIVLLEAAACGLPVIGSRLDASQEVVAALGAGEVVDPDDPESLKAGIRAALAAPSGERPPGLETFAWPAFERRVHGLLDGLSAESQR